MPRRLKPKDLDPRKVIDDAKDKVKKLKKVKASDLQPPTADEAKQMLVGKGPKRVSQRIANNLAVQYSEKKENGDFDDCVVVVAAACVVAGAYYGGPVGAALAVGGGIPVARLACRRVFEEEE